MRNTNTFLKFTIVWTAILIFRLIPWRAPNVEPILAALMPMSKRYGALSSFLFAFLAIVIYDAITSGWGQWTWITACTYGAIAIASHFYFASKEATRARFVIFGVVATLFYDAVTGFIIGPVFHGQPFGLAVAGQIPFTVLHLLGTVVFASLLSPVIDRWIVSSNSFELSSLWKRELANN